MNKKTRAKLKALLLYTFGIIIIEWFFISNADNWKAILMGTLLAVLNLVHVFRLLDIEPRIPISRKWYYIFLTTVTIGFLGLLLKYF